MNNLNITSRLANMLVALTMLLPACAWAQTPPDASRGVSPLHTSWVERPWELRYVLYVEGNWGLSKAVATRLQDEEGPVEKRRRWQTILDRTYFLPSKDKWASRDDGLSVIVIEFDKDGTVSSPHLHETSLRGRLDRLMRVSMAVGSPEQVQFELGEWFLGFGDASTHWAPALCNSGDMPSPFSKTDTGYLYGPAFLIGPARRTFGCREWAYQMGDPERPYIDVTSYIPKKLDPDGSGAYIRDSVGWARFSDPTKPIIGKHDNDWYCLHECPDGGEPGLIPDINDWARKQGWPVPKRPTRVPVFPDPPAKTGVYPR